MNNWDLNSLLPSFKLHALPLAQNFACDYTVVNKGMLKLDGNGCLLAVCMRFTERIQANFCSTPLH